MPIFYGLFASLVNSHNGSLGIAVILNKRLRGFCMNREKGSKKSVLFREIRPIRVRKVFCHADSQRARTIRIKGFPTLW
jgi:hypothetical protein